MKTVCLFQVYLITRRHFSIPCSHLKVVLHYQDTTVIQTQYTELSLEQDVMDFHLPRGDCLRPRDGVLCFYRLAVAKHHLSLRPGYIRLDIINLTLDIPNTESCLFGGFKVDTSATDYPTLKREMAKGRVHIKYAMRKEPYELILCQHYQFSAQKSPKLPVSTFVSSMHVAYFVFYFYSTNPMESESRIFIRASVSRCKGFHIKCFPDIKINVRSHVEVGITFKPESQELLDLQRAECVDNKDVSKYRYLWSKTRHRSHQYNLEHELNMWAPHLQIISKLHVQDDDYEQSNLLYPAESSRCVYLQRIPLTADIRTNSRHTPVVRCTHVFVQSVQHLLNLSIEVRPVEMSHDDPSICGWEAEYAQISNGTMRFRHLQETNLTSNRDFTSSCHSTHPVSMFEGQALRVTFDYRYMFFIMQLNNQVMYTKTHLSHDYLYNTQYDQIIGEFLSSVTFPHGSLAYYNTELLLLLDAEAPSVVSHHQRALARDIVVKYKVKEDNGGNIRSGFIIRSDTENRTTGMSHN